MICRSCVTKIYGHKQSSKNLELDNLVSMKNNLKNLASMVYHLYTCRSGETSQYGSGNTRFPMTTICLWPNCSTRTKKLIKSQIQFNYD